jgi:type III pantothenate kinase
MIIWGVDIGHTRLKWATLGSSGILNTQAEGYGHFSESFLDRIWGLLVPPEVLWVADVCQVTPLLKAWVAKRWGSELIALTSEAAFGGVTSGYEHPHTLGIDRWLDLLGAWALYPGEASLVIDAGTYVTLDLLLENGQHAGGMIVPGIRRAKPFQLGYTTQTCLDAGNGVLARGFVQQATQEVQKKVPNLKNVILTGGDAPQLDIKLTNLNLIYKPNLLMNGLKCRMMPRADEVRVLA